MEKKIEETYKLAKENHRMLKKIRRNMVWSGIFRALYWLIIIGAALGLYYVLQPVYADVMDAYNSVKDSVNDVKEVGQKIPGIGGVFDSSDNTSN